MLSSSRDALLKMSAKTVPDSHLITSHCMMVENFVVTLFYLTFIVQGKKFSLYVVCIRP